MIKYRSIFIATEGCSFIKVDYNQMELRMAAIISEDSSMISDFKRNIDIHLRTAKMGFKLDIPEEALITEMLDYKTFRRKFNKQRELAKAINFGLIYGMTRWGAAERLGIDYNEAQKFIDSFFSLYPQIEQQKERCFDEVKRNGYGTSLFGRRRRFPLIDTKVGDKAFQFKIAGSCADLMRLAMVKTCERFRGQAHIWPVLTVHDEMVYECKDAQLDECVPVIKDISENCISFPVLMTADIKINKEYD